MSTAGQKAYKLSINWWIIYICPLMMPDHAGGMRMLYRQYSWAAEHLINGPLSLHDIELQC